MRVLGIDCGCEKTGFGVVDTDGRTHRFIVAGVIRTSTADPLPTRLAHIHEKLTEALRRYRPEFVAIEEVFHATNVKTALKLAHVRGIALLAAAQAGVPVGEYSPLEVKASVWAPVADDFWTPRDWTCATLMDRSSWPGPPRPR